MACRIWGNIYIAWANIQNHKTINILYYQSMNDMEKDGLYFIELPCMLYSSRESDIMNKSPDECELIEVMKRIDIRRIESYSEAIPISDLRDDNKIWTNIVMYSGDAFLVNMTYNNFEALFFKRMLKDNPS